MTLIAAVPCVDGVVVCADSLEAAGDYKVSVQKVRPIAPGSWTIVFGGAGNDASLIDGLEDTLQRAFKKQHKGDLVTHVRRAVAGFYRNEVALHPGTPEDKRIEAVLCVKRTDPQERPNLFHIAGPVVRERQDCVLVGWDATLYKNFLERLYSSDMQVGRAITLALHVFLLAKNTCMWIGGDTKLIVLTEHGIFEDSKEDVQGMEARLMDVNRRVEEIIIAGPDPTTHPTWFEYMLRKFAAAMMSLQEEYLRIEGRKLIKHLPNKYVGYQTLPFGTMLMGDKDVEGAYALSIPEYPVKYGTKATTVPAEDAGKPGTVWKSLWITEKWKEHGPSVRFELFPTNSSLEEPLPVEAIPIPAPERETQSWAPPDKSSTNSSKDQT